MNSNYLNLLILSSPDRSTTVKSRTPKGQPTSCKRTCSPPLARSLVATTVKHRLTTSAIILRPLFWSLVNLTSRLTLVLPPGIKSKYHAGGPTSSHHHCIIMWVKIGHLGAVRALLESPEQGYIHVALLLVPARQDRHWACVQAHPCRRSLLGGAQGPSLHLSLSKDPVKGHNHINGPRRRVLTRYPGSGTPINIYRSPIGLRRPL